MQTQEEKGLESLVVMICMRVSFPQSALLKHVFCLIRHPESVTPRPHSSGIRSLACYRVCEVTRELLQSGGEAAVKGRGENPVHRSGSGLRAELPRARLRICEGVFLRSALDPGVGSRFRRYTEQPREVST